MIKILSYIINNFSNHNSTLDAILLGEKPCSEEFEVPTDILCMHYIDMDTYYKLDGNIEYMFYYKCVNGQIYKLFVEPFTHKLKSFYDIAKSKYSDIEIPKYYKSLKIKRN